MGKYIEITRGIVGLIRSFIHPIYLTNDISENHKLLCFHIPTRTKHNLSGGEINILSWNILRNYNMSFPPVQEK